MYQVEFPLPVREASSNRRGRWQKHSKPYAGYKEDCILLARNAANRGNWPRPIGDRVEMDLDFYMCRTEAKRTGSYCALDWDNAITAFKPVQDALKEAGLLAGDTLRKLRPGRITYQIEPNEHKGRACVVVTLRPI